MNNSPSLAAAAFVFFLLIAPCSQAGPQADGEPSPTATQRVVSLLHPERVREQAEQARISLERERENGSVSTNQYREGIHEYKKEIQEYREKSKSDKSTPR